jgi:hypothetical protein
MLDPVVGPLDGPTPLLGLSLGSGIVKLTVPLKMW